MLDTREIEKLGWTYSGTLNLFNNDCDNYTLIQNNKTGSISTWLMIVTTKDCLPYLTIKTIESSVESRLRIDDLCIQTKKELKKLMKQLGIINSKK